MKDILTIRHPATIQQPNNSAVDKAGLEGMDNLLVVIQSTT